jgi:hypothetical protein
VNKQIIDEAIDIVSSYVGETKDWMVIKKELLKTLTPADRMYFSTRDPVTKKQKMNAFEQIIAEKWYQKTGIYPILIGRNENESR